MWHGPFLFLYNIEHAHYAFKEGVSKRPMTKGSLFLFLLLFDKSRVNLYRSKINFLLCIHFLDSSLSKVPPLVVCSDNSPIPSLAKSAPRESAWSLFARTLLRRRSLLTYSYIVSHFSYTVGRHSLFRYCRTIPHFLRSVASSGSIALFVYSHDPYRRLFTSVVRSAASSCSIGIFVHSHDPYKGLFTAIAQQF